MPLDVRFRGHEETAGISYAYFCNEVPVRGGVAGGAFPDLRVRQLHIARNISKMAMLPVKAEAERALDKSVGLPPVKRSTTQPTQPARLLP